MTELERFAAALLTQWRADGRTDGGPIAVSALLTKVFPYRVARRTLGIDVSEDYEALVLRLLSEEEDLVRVEPVDAADMARATITSKLPDLDVLQLLRAATVTITSRSIARLEGVLPMPTAKDESKWAEADSPVELPPDAAAATRTGAEPAGGVTRDGTDQRHQGDPAPGGARARSGTSGADGTAAGVPDHGNVLASGGGAVLELQRTIPPGS